MTKPSYN